LQVVDEVGVDAVDVASGCRYHEHHDKPKGGKERQDAFRHQLILQMRSDGPRGSMGA
jgi:hypothetical protein